MNRKIEFTRRTFIRGIAAASALGALSPVKLLRSEEQKAIIKPGRLSPGDTVGLIAPASAAFEPATIREGVETLQSLGYRVKVGEHIDQKYGYLAGSDKNRVDDLHRMFEDESVTAIFALRGGYGSMRLLNLIDYQLIRKHPKIFIGYSDITSLNLGIFAQTGLITFHGPVAISSFSKYTLKYFTHICSSPDPVGLIEHPAPDNALRPTAHLNTIRPGKAAGRLIGGNLTLLTALLGTPYDVDTAGAILFLEETGEEPYDIDRMLTQLILSGKLSRVAGVMFDRCPDCQPSEYKPAFSSTFSLEEVLIDRLSQLDCPVLYGLNLGHEADKPTLPNGIQVTLDATNKTLSFDEGAVV
ncbi:MAG: S66 peptidase family protein [Candidatus Zhuqueibacterota bacterium]